MICIKCKFAQHSKDWECGEIYDVDENTQVRYITNSRIDGYPLFELVKGDLNSVLKGGIKITKTFKGSVEYIPTLVDDFNENLDKN